MGLPTFIGGGLLWLRITDGNNLLYYIIIMIPFLKIYELVYLSIFPGYDTTGKKMQLIFLFLSQIAIWVAGLYVANQVLT